MDGASLTVTPDFDAKHPVQLTKVHNLDVLMQSGLELLNKVKAGGSNGTVINMHSSDDELTFMCIDLEEDGLID